MVKRWVKQLITWLYTRYVLQPEVCAGLAQHQDYEIVLIPNEIMHAQIQSRFNVKH